MHTNEDYEKSIEEENDYSDFYNTAEEEEIEKKEKSNKKPIIIIIILALILIALIVLLIFVFKKKAPVEFNLGLENVTGDAWTKENVTINVDIPDETDLKSVKYTINCTDNCEYAEVNDKKIVISNSGLSVVTVVVTNVDNVENKKDITVKIDNVAPVLTLSPRETEIKATGTTTVCAICEDKESGCKEERVCQEYTKTSKNQTLTIEDNAGNKTTSSKFNVTISTGDVTPKPDATPSCSLEITKDGYIKATIKNADAYYGFSSNYSGTKSTSKEISVDENGQTEAFKYYVKNSNGKTASCSIEVEASGCHCTYRDSTGKCYRKEVKVLNDPKSKECVGPTRVTEYECQVLSNPGKVCNYSKKVAK